MRTSIWLVPAETPEANLRRDMRALREARPNSAPFRPHLTLASGPYTPLDLSRVTRRFGEIVLPRAGVLSEPHQFTRTFALQYQRTSQLAVLQQELKEILPEEFGYEQIPHLSLVYGDTGPRKDLELVAAKYHGPMRFNRMVLVQTPDSVKTQQDVAEWREGSLLKLRGGVGGISPVRG